MDVIPLWVRKLWDAFDLRITVLVSLSFQIILFVLGNRRKYIIAYWLRFTLWPAYLIADWIAIVALGKLSSSGDEYLNDHIIDPNNALRALWAPMLLLHLGGPDTITAYAMEDNSLWLRHFLQMGAQVAVAFYVFLLSWNHWWFPYLWFPLFMAGTIKHGERTWVFWRASREQSKWEVPLGKFSTHNNQFLEQYLRDNPGVNALVRGHQLLVQYKPYIVSHSFPAKEETFMTALSSGHVANNESDTPSVRKDVLEAEMGLMYDFIYTKAAITYTKFGCFLRVISIACTFSALAGYFLIIIVFRPRNLQHRGYSTVDVAITGVLLVGAITLETYALICMLSSDWALLWLIKHSKNWLVSRLLPKLTWLFSLGNEKRRWSNLMGQFSLISYCFQEPSMLDRFKGLSSTTDEWIDNYKRTSHVCVPNDMDRVFINLYNVSGEVTNLSAVIMADFDESIMVWHITTEICYHILSSTNQQAHLRETSKFLSRYMMYLQIQHPAMLPTKVWHSLFGVTRNNLRRTFSVSQNTCTYENTESKLTRACNLLKDKVPEFTEVDYDVLQKAVKLYRFLEGKDNRWEVIISAWMKMLRHTANQCPQFIHACQLIRGGEFLTLVWLQIIQTDHNQARVEPGKPQEDDKDGCVFHEMDQDENDLFNEE